MPATKAAIFPGSFDPLTNGHTDIVSRALQIFDKLIVAVLSNTEKKTLFSVDERLDLIRHEFESYGPRVEARSFSGLLVDFASQQEIRIIVRGLRAISDYDYEAQMALMNKSLNDKIETVFLVAREENSYVSATMVKQVAALGGGVARYVPKGVAEALREKLGK